MGFVNPEGSGSLGVLMMGEAGGGHERVQGLPFRPNAPAGSVLERAIKLAGFSRSQFRLANTVNCSPPRDWLVGAPWEFGAIAHCELHRSRIIQEMKPKVILALGGTAFRTLTGFSGKGQGIEIMRGYPIETEQGLVLGTLHPSHLVRGQMRLMGLLVHDIQRAVRLARTGFQKREIQYCMFPSVEEALQFEEEVRANPDLPLAYDIETPMTKGGQGDEELYEEEEPDVTPITSIQFSLHPGTGIYFPWIEPFIGIATRILGLPNPKIGHNCLRFDNRRLKEHGVRVKGTIHDTMEAFRHLQRDLRNYYNLQAVASFYGGDRPWKHLSESEPEFYGITDVDMDQRIWAKLPEDMKKRGIW